MSTAFSNIKVLSHLSKSSFNRMVEAEPDGSGLKSEWEEIKMEAA